MQPLLFEIDPPKPPPRPQYRWPHEEAAHWRHMHDGRPYQPRLCKQIILDMCRADTWVGGISIYCKTRMPTRCVTWLLGQLVRQGVLEERPLYFIPPLRVKGFMEFTYPTMEERLVCPPMDRYRGYEGGYRKVLKTAGSCRRRE